MFDSFLTGIGIDISEHHIRFAQVSLFGGVKHLEEVDLPDGLIIDEKVEKGEEIKKILRQNFKRSVLEKVTGRATLLLPESRVFSYSFILPKDLKKDEILIESKKTAQREIPIPFSLADVAVSQGSAEEGGIRTTLYAIDTHVSKGFQDIVSSTPFRMVAIEANTKAVHRLVTKNVSARLLPKNVKELIAIVDVGHSWTSISVYTLRGSSMYSRSFSYNLLQDGAVGSTKLSQAIVNIIIDTIREVMVYFEKRGQRVVSVYLSGFEALDKKLNTSLKTVTSKEVPVQPLSKVITLPGINASRLHKFGGAIGAALRSVTPFRYNYQHNLLSKK